MLDISIHELVRRKKNLEKMIMEKIQSPIAQFQKETNVGIKYVDIEMIYVSQFEDVPKYMIGNVSVKLDFDFIDESV